MFHCSVSGCSCVFEIEHDLRTYVSCSNRSLRAPDNLVLHPNLHRKLSITSSLVVSGKQLNIDTEINEAHETNEHFQDSTNSTSIADEVIERSFAGPNGLESNNNVGHFDENAFAIRSAPALFGDAY